jgi:hypothetical protein
LDKRVAARAGEGMVSVEFAMGGERFFVTLKVLAEVKC